MSEQPKLLVIELDSLEAVPKVIFKGEEVTNKMLVDFTWKTSAPNDDIFETPYIRIESMEGLKTKKPSLRVQGYNERVETDQTTALMLAVVGLNKALEAVNAVNAAANEEDPFKNAGEPITTEEAANNIMKAGQAIKDSEYSGDISLEGRQNLKKPFVKDGDSNDQN